MDTCPCNIRSKNEKFRDIEILKDSKILIDKELRYLILNIGNINHYYKKTEALPKFNAITLDLVNDNDIYTYIKYYMDNIIANRLSILIEMASSDKPLYYNIFIDLRNFPLLEPTNASDILKKIKKRASEFLIKNKEVICLELLYCYGILINPDYNWIIMDYINQGNKYHQYMVANMFNFLE